jgi:hypothetical protein
MQRLLRVLLIAVVLTLCWQLMLAAHEAGHVLGAWLTGGRVTQVVLRPLLISRTDVDPDPHPGVVAWSGPLGGVLVPAVIAVCLPRRRRATRRLAVFFAGFCLIANGAYIGVGAFLPVGDGEVMLRTGTPPALMLAFGVTCVLTGLWLWHRLGSVGEFLRGSDRTNRTHRTEPEA